MSLILEIVFLELEVEKAWAFLDGENLLEKSLAMIRKNTGYVSIPSVFPDVACGGKGAECLPHKPLINIGLFAEKRSQASCRNRKKEEGI